MKRILLLGDQKTGKTTFFQIFLGRKVEQNKYTPTQNLQAAAKTLKFQNNQYINVQLWDTPGIEQLRKIAQPFFQNCKLFVLFVDRSNIDTLKTFSQWVEKIYRLNPNYETNIVVILNKTETREEFTQTELQTMQVRQINQLYREKVKIKCISVDLVRQKENLQDIIIKPFIKETCEEDILVETTENFGTKYGVKGANCGEINCNNHECQIM